MEDKVWTHTEVSYILSVLYALACLLRLSIVFTEYNITVGNLPLAYQIVISSMLFIIITELPYLWLSCD